MSVHDTARRGFASAAGVYEESRPGYPAEAIEWLRAKLQLGPEGTLVDLAAGTGKLTRLLTPTGATVIAIEPVEEMRDALRSTTPDADAREGTAEQTGLPDSSADAVTVAQALHWFDAPKALAEIHRILRAEGRLALVWNIRDLDDPTQRAIDDLFTAYRGDTPSHRSGHWRDALDASEIFESTETNRFPTSRPSTPTPSSAASPPPASSPISPTPSASESSTGPAPSPPTSPAASRSPTPPRSRSSTAASAPRRPAPPAATSRSGTASGSPGRAAAGP